MLSTIALMHIPAWCLLALPALSAAQTTVVSLLDLGPLKEFVGSVVAADAEATTYKLSCPSANGCGYGPRPVEITVVAGPSTAVDTVIVDANTQFSTIACAITTAAPTQNVVCTRVGKDRTSFSWLDHYSSLTYVPLTVTAGVEKLPGGSPGGPTTPASEPTATTTPTTSQIPSTTVTLFHTVWGDVLAASVVSADATATTYKLGCPGETNDPPYYCGYGSAARLPTLTAVGGPSTAAQTLSFADLDLEVVVTCKLSAPTAGVCVISEHSGALSTTVTRNAAPSDFGPIKVTAGLEKLDQAKPAETSPAKSSSSGTKTNGGMCCRWQRPLTTWIIGVVMYLLAV